MSESKTVIENNQLLIEVNDEILRGYFIFNAAITTLCIILLFFLYFNNRHCEYCNIFKVHWLVFVIVIILLLTLLLIFVIALLTIDNERNKLENVNIFGKDLDITTSKFFNTVLMLSYCIGLFLTCVIFFDKPKYVIVYILTITLPFIIVYTINLNLLKMLKSESKNKINKTKK